MNSLQVKQTLFFSYNSHSSSLCYQWHLPKSLLCQESPLSSLSIWYGKSGYVDDRMLGNNERTLSLKSDPDCIFLSKLCNSHLELTSAEEDDFSLVLLLWKLIGQKALPISGESLNHLILPCSPTEAWSSHFKIAFSPLQLGLYLPVHYKAIEAFLICQYIMAWRSRNTSEVSLRWCEPSRQSTYLSRIMEQGSLSQLQFDWHPLSAKSWTCCRYHFGRSDFHLKSTVSLHYYS